jgi:hypothetical protein
LIIVAEFLAKQLDEILRLTVYEDMDKYADGRTGRE